MWTSFILRAVLIVAFAAAVPAQTGLRSVRGTVTDQNGKPLEGAVVKIESLGTLRIRSFVTRKDGEYHFQQLFANTTYELRAEYRGKSSSTGTLSKFDSRKEAVINLKIET